MVVISHHFSFLLHQVCCQALDLPQDVEVVSASVAGGHLSSASIYPACFSPYQFVTACSDGEVRFWNCRVVSLGQSSEETSTYSTTSYEFSMEEGDVKGRPLVNTRKEERKKEFNYSWSEWERPSSSRDKSSSVGVPGMVTARM